MAVTLAPRRDGRWSLLSAASLCELSHRTCRTIVAMNKSRPELQFPAPTQNLLVLKVLGEAYLFTPPQQSSKRKDPVTLKERDDDLVRFARSIWDEDLTDAYIMVTATHAHLCSSADRIPVQFATLKPDTPVAVLPVGVWMAKFKDIIVDKFKVAS